MIQTSSRMELTTVAAGAPASGKSTARHRFDDYMLREMGLKSTYDLLVATRRKFQSERDLAKTGYERIQALKKLEVVVGGF